MVDDVLIGASVVASRTNLVAAINGTRHCGRQLRVDTLPNPDASAAAPVGNNIALTAKKTGTPGNAVATTETMADAGAFFGLPTLTGGASPWVTETIPLAQGSNPSTVAVVHSDDEISLVKDGSDNIYIATETQRTCVR